MRKIQALPRDSHNPTILTRQPTFPFHAEPRQNYDLCVETNCSASSIERGFNDKRQWDWRLFDEQVQTEKNLFLYKLHGSIDWTHDSEGNLTYLDSISQITPDAIAIIFGTSYKLQYVDPFLFFAYEFRR